MPYIFPPPGALLPPMVNDAPQNWTPLGQDYDNYLLQRNFQGIADTQNKTAADFYLRNPDGTFYNWYYWSYDTGRVPYNSLPPDPPNQKWVTTEWQDGIFIRFVLVDMPGMPVCTVPGYHRQPPPQH